MSLPDWHWIVLIWIALGVVVVIVIETAARSGSTRGPLSQDTFILSAGFTLALIVGAPFLMLFVLGVSAPMVWKGRVPTTNAVWWPSRAAMFEGGENSSIKEQRRETTLCNLIELRRPHDPALRKTGRPSNWPMFRLFHEPEAEILDIVEQYAWLRDAGLSEAVAVERMAETAWGERVMGFSGDQTLRGHLVAVLQERHPRYLTLPESVLAKTVEMAETWTSAQIAQAKERGPYPPSSWLERKLTLREAYELLGLEPGETADLPSRFGQEWRRLEMRMVAEDALWSFNSPPETWQQMCGRAGIALVRNGRAIAHVTTMMN